MLKILALMLVAIMLLVAVGCDGKADGENAGNNADSTTADNADNNQGDGQAKTEAKLDYSNVVLSDYIKSINYKGLTVLLENESSSKQDAVWEAVLASVDMEFYPVEPVQYYFNQTKRLYMEAVGNNEDDYYSLLISRGISENDMLADAQAFVKEDLVFLYITQTEQISVSEQEKQELFDKYVDKYVSDYGYKRIYVIANMSELIYESMLYDKTTEYLILNNTFEVKSEGNN
ncbi:MAG: hypothetical protein E7653_04675 [Ruminococcaceae bacterium]|nr:hypothetical protein [Oscillospiraceae bacterium]